jgi:hypothetical protein
VLGDGNVCMFRPLVYIAPLLGITLQVLVTVRISETAKPGVNASTRRIHCCSQDMYGAGKHEKSNTSTAATSRKLEWNSLMLLRSPQLQKTLYLNFGKCCRHFTHCTIHQTIFSMLMSSHFCYISPYLISQDGIHLRKNVFVPQSTANVSYVVRIELSWLRFGSA